MALEEIDSHVRFPYGQTPCSSIGLRAEGNRSFSSPEAGISVSFMLDEAES